MKYRYDKKQFVHLTLMKNSIDAFMLKSLIWYEYEYNI